MQPQASPLFLMPSMAVQVSAGTTTSPHRHTAAQIVMAMDNHLRVRTLPTDDWAECSAVLIPPNVAHHILSPATPIITDMV